MSLAPAGNKSNTEVGDVEDRGVCAVRRELHNHVRIADNCGAFRDIFLQLVNEAVAFFSHVDK